jgi:hypothetical protein
VTGHEYVPSPLAAAFGEPERACLRCGQPEAAHDEKAQLSESANQLPAPNFYPADGPRYELAARRTAAAAVLADYRRQDLATLAPLELAAWAGRLAAELQSVLDQLQREQSHVAWLAHQEIVARYQQTEEDQ